MSICTRFGWGRFQITLVSSGEDVNPAGPIVSRGCFNVLHITTVDYDTLNTGNVIDSLKIYTRNEWRRFKTTHETSEKDSKLHSKRVERLIYFWQMLNGPEVLHTFGNPAKRDLFTWKLTVVLN
jgi:hypothetical protein